MERLLRGHTTDHSRVRFEGMSGFLHTMVTSLV